MNVRFFISRHISGPFKTRINSNRNEFKAMVSQAGIGVMTQPNIKNKTGTNPNKAAVAKYKI